MSRRSLACLAASVLLLWNVPGPAPAEAGGGAVRAVSVIVSDWGTFRCDSIACGHLPRLGLRLYWSSPTLIVTRHHVPLLSRVCDPVSARPRTWDCRNGFVDRGAVNASSGEETLLGWNDEGEDGW